MPPPLPLIIIVTPYLAAANNGNWRTAHRWQSLLSGDFRVIVQGDWQGEPCDVLIALHARRSANAIQRFRDSHPQTPLIVVLTGTDLYKDLAINQDAQRSLVLADALIVLQEDAIQHVPLEYRKKTHIVYQSARTLAPAAKPRAGPDPLLKRTRLVRTAAFLSATFVLLARENCALSKR